MNEKTRKVKDPDYEIQWAKEGDGWIGRWLRNTGNDIDSNGAWGQFEVAPEGGLHGQWAWSNPFCSGRAPRLDQRWRNFTLRRATLDATSPLQG